MIAVELFLNSDTVHGMLEEHCYSIDVVFPFIFALSDKDAD